MTILATATGYWNAGLNTLPIRTDGSKAPAVEQWEKWHTYNQGASDIHELFHGREVGIAIIAGGVSGGLEVIDFDVQEAFVEWRELVCDLDCDLYDSLTIVKSPRGFHVYIRSDFFDGNKKLASTIIDGKKKTKVETRGKGGYVLAPGCPASCHETGLSYELIAGSFAQIPRLNEEQRTLLIDAARSLNEVEERAVNVPHSPSTPSGERPGDEYEARASWDEILTPFGWRAIRDRGGVTSWCRPGKSRGISATTGAAKCGGKLFIFSSNADPFEDGRAYSKFAAYLALNHAGDASAGAKALRALGYGKARTRPQLVPPPPSDMDAPPPFDEAPPPDMEAPYIPPLTAPMLEDMLDDDAAAWLRPATFARIIAARSDRAEFELLYDVMRRRKKAKAFSEALKEHDKKQKRAVDSDGWKSQLLFRETKDGGQVVDKCLANLKTILLNDPAWKGKIRLNSFLMRFDVSNDLPFERREDERWSDVDVSNTKIWLEVNYGIRPSDVDVNNAIATVAHAQQYNPMREYVDNLPEPSCDSDDIIETWACDFFGCDDTPINRAFASKFLIGAIARVYKPGEKVDSMIVLEGRQGLGKSKFLKALCPDPEWFTDGLSEFGSKEQAVEIEGKWIVELAELKGFGKDLDQVKAFMSRTAENYRPPYARNSIHSPRKCVYAGTVNIENVGYLRDVTGNRRFWPLLCKKKAPDLTPEIRDRLWAEAKQRYLAGEKWFFDDGEEELLASAEAEQKKRVAVDVWEEDIEDYLVGKPDVTVREILAHLNFDVQKRTPGDGIRVGRVLTSLGWTDTHRPRVNGKQGPIRYLNPNQAYQQIGLNLANAAGN